jgi:hypothetical protein
MGFALWLRDDQAWAMGTHEYRPMGTAVISARGVFSPRDFHRLRPAPSRTDPSLAGLFASLGEMNDYLKFRSAARPRSQQQRFFLRKSVNSSMPEF